MLRDCIKANRLTALLHPRFSPGLLPTDFCLFGYLKGDRRPEGLFENVDYILRRISSDELGRV
jgi:hypothetical protein